MRVLKFALLALGVTLLIVTGLVAFHLGGFTNEAEAVWQVPAPPIVAVDDSAVLARGAHVGGTLGGCAGCHGPNLSGGLVEDLGPIGQMYAPNLTSGRGGVGALYSDAELARAIRHGIRRDGTSLRFMPTPEHNWWPDEDLQAVVSWVRSHPPVDNDVPPTRVGALGKMLHRFGIFEMFSAQTVDHDQAPPAVEPGPTVAYGELLARGCAGCHGENLSGGKIPGAPAELPIPRNLTRHDTGLGAWSEADFATALRTGVRPDGSELLEFMPRLPGLTDTEVSALWAYLGSVEPREFGGR